MFSEEYFGKRLEKNSKSRVLVERKRYGLSALSVHCGDPIETVNTAHLMHFYQALVLLLEHFEYQKIKTSQAKKGYIIISCDVLFMSNYDTKSSAIFAQTKFDFD